MIFCKKSKETKILLGFNYYSSDKGFYCGYVIDYGNEFAIIQHYTKYGISDGLLTIKLSDVKYLEVETHYLLGLSILVENELVLTKPTYLLSKNHDFSENFTNLFESFIGNKQQILKFELIDGNLYFGFMGWCGDDFFSIIGIEIDGTIIGKSVFKLKDLKMYWVDDLECRKINLLYQERVV